MSLIKTLIDRVAEAAPAVVDALATRNEAPLSVARPVGLIANPGVRLAMGLDVARDRPGAGTSDLLSTAAPQAIVLGADADGITAAWTDTIRAERPVSGATRARVRAPAQGRAKPSPASSRTPAKAKAATAKRKSKAPVARNARSAGKAEKPKPVTAAPGSTGSPTPSATIGGTDASETAIPASARARKAGAGLDSSKPPVFGRRKTDRIARKAMTAAVARADEPGVDGSKSDRAMKLDEVVEFTRSNRKRVLEAKSRIHSIVVDTLDVSEALKMKRADLAHQIEEIVQELHGREGLQLNLFEQRDLVTALINDMIGLGPLEPLLGDESISEIMVNGPKKIYVERNGKIELTNYTFEDNAHALNICQRIVGRVGRRVDEASPICDARLKDGSRVNVIVPPLALDGPVITIRRFTKEKLTLDKLVDFGAMTPRVADLLRVIGACRLNVLISGGTGSGKTTLLNCLTGFIEAGERVITCEDAAELQLQQTHVVRLETRPPNIEGKGEVTMRELVRNCLRMRPERIIVGEVRGSEAFDLLQAMNTGHDGSMGTVHANSPREAVSRIENMIAMGGFNMPAHSVREQISAAIDVIIQTERLRDGSRKITRISEVIGMEDYIMTMQDLVTFEIKGEDERGRIVGEHQVASYRPGFWDKAREFGLEGDLFTVMDLGEEPIRIRA